MEIEPLGGRARKGVYWNVCLKLIHQIYHFVVLIIVARILEPRDFGAMAVTMSIVIYFNSLTGFGFINAIVQREHVERQLIDCVFTFNLLISLAIVPFLFCSSSLISSILNVKEIDNILPILVVIIPIASFYNLPMALLRKDLNFKLYSIIDTFQYVIFSTVILILSLVGMGLWSLVVGCIVGYITSVIILLMFSDWRPKFNFNIIQLKKIIEYGSFDIIRFHVKYLEENAVNFIASKFLGVTFLGYYDRANSISSMPIRKIQSQIDLVLFSVFSKIQNDKDRMLESLLKSFVSVSCLFFPLLVGLAMVAPKLVEIFFGEKWIGMIIPLQILCISGLFRVLNSCVSNFNIAVNLYKFQTYVNLFNVIFYIVLCIIGAQYGINGIAFAGLVSSFFGFLYSCYLTSKYLGFNSSYFLISLLPSSLGSLIMVISIYTISYLIEINNEYITFAVKIFIGFVSYIIFIFFAPIDILKQIRAQLFGDLLNIFRGK